MSRGVNGGSRVDWVLFGQSDQIKVWAGYMMHMDIKSHGMTLVLNLIQNPETEPPLNVWRA